MRLNLNMCDSSKQFSSQSIWTSRRRHDSTILARSGLLGDLQEHTIAQEWFYTLHLWGSCIPPSPPTPKAIWGSTNNTSSGSMKSGNEQCTCLSRVDIRRHNKLFQICRLQLSAVGKKYIVSVLLQNVRSCFYGSTTSEFFDCEPPTIEEYFQ